MLVALGGLSRTTFSEARVSPELPEKYSNLLKRLIRPWWIDDEDNVRWGGGRGYHHWPLNTPQSNTGQQGRSAIEIRGSFDGEVREHEGLGDFQTLPLNIHSGAPVAKRTWGIECSRLK